VEGKRRPKKGGASKKKKGRERVTGLQKRTREDKAKKGNGKTNEKNDGKKRGREKGPVQWDNSGDCSGLRETSWAPASRGSKGPGGSIVQLRNKKRGKNISDDGEGQLWGGRAAEGYGEANKKGGGRSVTLPIQSRAKNDQENVNGRKKTKKNGRERWESTGVSPNAFAREGLHKQRISGSFGNLGGGGRGKRQER